MAHWYCAGCLSCHACVPGSNCTEPCRVNVKTSVAMLILPRAQHDEFSFIIMDAMTLFRTHKLTLSRLPFYIKVCLLKVTATSQINALNNSEILSFDTQLIYMKTLTNTQINIISLIHSIHQTAPDSL